MHRSFKSKTLVTASLLLSLISPLPLPGTTSGTSSALAQAPTTQDRKTQADRLLDEGLKQLNASQFQAALQSLQQALTIYQEIQDRSGEGQALKNLGNTYYALKDYTKAIEYQQQALAIAKRVKRSADRTGNSRSRTRGKGFE